MPLSLWVCECQSQALGCVAGAGVYSPLQTAVFHPGVLVGSSLPHPVPGPQGQERQPPHPAPSGKSTAVGGCELGKGKG